MRGLCFIYCYTLCSVIWPKSDGPSFSLDTVSRTCVDDYNKNDVMVLLVDSDSTANGNHNSWHKVQRLRSGGYMWKSLIVS